MKSPPLVCLFDKHRDSYHFIFKIVPRNDKSQEFEGPKTN
jgi:hypothetical protein